MLFYSIIPCLVITKRRHNILHLIIFYLSYIYARIFIWSWRNSIPILKLCGDERGIKKIRDWYDGDMQRIIHHYFLFLDPGLHYTCAHAHIHTACPHKILTVYRWKLKIVKSSNFLGWHSKSLTICIISCFQVAYALAWFNCFFHVQLPWILV